MARLSIFLLALLAASCSPRKEGRLIEGIFLINGKPQPGVEVHFTRKIDEFSSCTGEWSTTTNENGKFSIMVKHLPIRPCFVVDEKIYSTFVIIDDHKDDPIHLKCSLPLEDTGHFEDGSICN